MEQIKCKDLHWTLRLWLASGWAGFLISIALLIALLIGLQLQI